MVIFPLEMTIEIVDFPMKNGGSLQFAKVEFHSLSIAVAVITIVTNSSKL